MEIESHHLLILAVFFALAVWAYNSKTIHVLYIQKTWKNETLVVICAKYVLCHLLDEPLPDLPDFAQDLSLKDWLNTLFIQVESFKTDEMIQQLGLSFEKNKDLERSKSSESKYIVENSQNKHSKFIYLASFDYSKEIYLSCRTDGHQNLNLVLSKIIDLLKTSEKVGFNLHYSTKVNARQNSGLLTAHYDI